MYYYLNWNLKNHFYNSKFSFKTDNSFKFIQYSPITIKLNHNTTLYMLGSLIK